MQLPVKTENIDVIALNYGTLDADDFMSGRNMMARIPTRSTEAVYFYGINRSILLNEVP